jgi:hypothetical protein
MIVESPVENSPPVIESAKIPEYARPWCDTWGNIKKEPLKTIEENHGPDFVKIFVYQAGPGFYFGYQLKLKKLILQKQANIRDVPFESDEKARRAARDELLSLADEKKIIREFVMFDKICYNQPELF